MKKDTIEENKLPLLKAGDSLELKQLFPEQHFTQPPPRYTEASLIKALEERELADQVLMRQLFPLFSIAIMSSGKKENLNQRRLELRLMTSWS